jgi:hypothetical protein
LSDKKVREGRLYKSSFSFSSFVSPQDQTTMSKNTHVQLYSFAYYYFENPDKDWQKNDKWMQPSLF